ncbi:MAG TPA: hypothetical protein VG867_03925 [Rhizomicrobium sp.]|nr:hypothetical protein [Rhizomicrobium sp.]
MRDPRRVPVSGSMRLQTTLFVSAAGAGAGATEAVEDVGELGGAGTMEAVD